MFLLSSCSTITNKKFTRIELHTKPDSITVVLDKKTVVTSPVILQVPRSTRDFLLQVRHNSDSAEFVFTSRVAPQVWGNFAFIYLCPVGFIIDAYSKTKMFSYRKDAVVDFSRSAPCIKQYFPDHNGRFFLTVKMPGLNFLTMRTGDSQSWFTLISGIMAGFHYYYNQHNFVSAEWGLAGAFNPDNQKYHSHSYPDTTVRAAAFMIMLDHNHDIKYASIGYGVNVNNYLYERSVSDTLRPGMTHYNDYSSWSLGLNVNVTFRLYSFLTFGLTYAPTLLDIRSCKLEYSHVVYFDVGMRLELKKHKQSKMKIIKWDPAYVN